METLIETSRLIMRKFCLDDVDAVYNFSIVPDVVRYTGDADLVKSKKDVKKIISDIWLAEYARYGYARYALIYKPDSKLIGFCGVKYEIELGGPDIGYRMLPEYWGKGIATEAVEAVLQYSSEVLGLKKIYGEVAVENRASCNVLLKTGFKQTDSYQKYGFSVNRYEIILSGI